MERAEGTLSLVKRLTYRPELTGLARALGLDQMLRKLYYRWAAPDGIVRFEVRQLDAEFYVRTPEELRVLEFAGIGQAIRWGEKQILELLICALRSGDIIYDVGANFGLYTVLLAKAVGEQGQVIAFEPDSRSYERLQENLKLNGVRNIRSFPKALGDQNGEAKLYLEEERTCLSSLLVRPGTREINHQLVEVVEGDRLREEQSLPVPQVVKIDVEGSEYAVIQGLRHTLADPVCELVCCEIHPHLLPAEVKPAQVLALLKSLGFDRIDLYPRGLEQHALCYKGQRCELERAGRS